MKAVITEKYGKAEILKIENRVIPHPKSNEILVQIKASSVTKAGIFMREGKPLFGRLFMGILKPKIKTPGTDLSGVIIDKGAEVNNFNIGDRIMAATDINCGAHAEYICLKHNDVITKTPKNSSYEEATGIIDGGSTALTFLTDVIKLKKGDKILINGGSGSIGTAAIQLAKYFGAEVTAISSTKNKSLVKDLGADAVLDYTKDELRKHSIKFDYIFDTVGMLSYRKSKKHLSKNGQFLTPVLRISTLLQIMFISTFSKNKLKFSATGLLPNDKKLKNLIKISHLLHDKKLITIIDRVYKLEEIVKAHKYVEKGHKRGNVILQINNNI
jgi:NADPH:quinone reductase-like Zn-dependent oxidoreductase